MAKASTPMRRSGDSSVADGQQEEAHVALLGGFGAVPKGRVRLVVSVASLAAEMAAVQRFAETPRETRTKRRGEVRQGVVLKAGRDSIDIFATNGERAAQTSVSAVYEGPEYQSGLIWSGVVGGKKILELCSVCSGKMAFQFSPSHEDRFSIVTETGAVFDLRRVAAADEYPANPFDDWADPSSDAQDKMQQITVSSRVFSKALASVLPVMSASGAKGSMVSLTQMRFSERMRTGATDGHRLMWRVDDDEYLAADPPDGEGKESWIASSLRLLIDGPTISIILDIVSEDAESSVVINFIGDRGFYFTDQAAGHRAFFFRSREDTVPPVEKLAYASTWKSTDDVVVNRVNILHAIAAVRTSGATNVLISVEADSGELALTADGEFKGSPVIYAQTVIPCEYSGGSDLRGVVNMEFLIDAVDATSGDDLKISFCGPPGNVEQFRVTDAFSSAIIPNSDVPWVVGIIAPTRL